MDKNISEPMTHQIYGLADLEKKTYLRSEVTSNQIKRLISLSQSDLIRFGADINVRKSILQRVKNLQIRTDLTDVGCVVMKFWLLKFMLDLEEKNTSAGSMSMLFEEFIPYVAKH